MTKNLADELQRTARQALSGLHPVPQGEEVGGLPFRKLLAATFRARYLVFSTTLFGLLVGAFLAITTANTYVSTGKFLFTASGAERTQFDPSRSIETSLETIGTAATYVLSTDELFKRVVKRLTPARILEPYKPGNVGESAYKAFFFKIQRDWNATREEDRTPEEALKRLRRTIGIERPRYTDVLVATCTANDPKLAQEILGVYMDEAKKWHIEQYEEQRAYDAAERTYTESGQAYEAARRALREFLERKAGVADYDDEKKRLAVNEAEAAALVTKTQDDLTIARGMVEVITRKLEGEGAIKPRRIVKSKVDTTTEASTRLQQEQGRAMMERASLIAKGAKLDNPQIVELDALIRQVAKDLASLSNEAKAAPLVEVEEANPDYTNAMNDRGKYELEVASLENRLQMVKTMHQVTAAKVKKLLDLEPEFERLHGAKLLAEDIHKAAQITWYAAQQKRSLRDRKSVV